MDTYRIGTPVRLTTVVYDENEVATNPTALGLTVRAPSGTETGYVLADLTDEAGVGAYSRLITADQEGTWAWQWTSTNPAAVDTGAFLVQGSAIGGTRVRGSGPCQAWCEPGDLTMGGWTAPAGAGAQLLEQACQAASEVVFELGGRRWPGLCWDSIIPQCCPSASWMPLVLPNGSGSLGMVSARHVGGPCWGGSIVDLGHGNVTAVDEVRIDGTAIASSAWRLLDGRWLARIDGSSWPCGNDPTAATIGFEVDFTFGSAPPALGVFAAIALARELARGLAAGGDCAIDPRVVGLVREGVSLDLSSVDGEGSFMEVEAVRRFVHTYNPHGLQRAAAVIVPGSDRHVHR